MSEEPESYEHHIKSGTASKLAEIAEDKYRLSIYEDSVRRTNDALGFLQGTAPAAFLGRPLAEYAAHLIKDLRASNTRMREALEASTDLFDHIEKAFTQGWCIDWGEIPKQRAKNRAALEVKK